MFVINYLSLINSLSKKKKKLKKIIFYGTELHTLIFLWLKKSKNIIEKPLINHLLLLLLLTT